MPFEMLTVCPVCGRLDIPAAIVATVNGVTTPFVAVQPVPDQVHFVNSCDVLSPASQPRVFAMSGACSPMVTHADGKLVTAANPATPGEEVAAYAVGLGQTDPPMTQGQPAPDAAPTVHQFAIDFNYHANALATKPAGPSFFGGPVPYAAPLFTGATAGMVGLYQVNFVVPAAPANLTGCSDTGNAFPFTNVIQSNLTVSIGSLFSFDGVAICVAG